MRSFVSALVVLIFCFCESAHAAEYYNKKWFDYPDLFTAPRVTTSTGCAHWVEGLGAKICTNPTHFTVRTELLRRDVVFVVSGPDSPSEAVRRAVAGYATGCSVIAVHAATTAAAATPSPEPGARIAAAAASLYGSFAACISAISVGGVAGSILGQLNIRIDTSSSHWSPL